MSRRKVLGPPKGAGAAVDAAAAAAAVRETEADRIERLSSRYQEDRAGEPLSWGPPPPTGGASPAPPPAPAVKTTPRPPRSEPAGMTRRTYYLPEAAADALADAVQRIQKATGGQVTKHEALGALISAGVAQTDQVAAGLRTELLRRLSNQ